MKGSRRLGGKCSCEDLASLPNLKCLPFRSRIGSNQNKRTIGIAVSDRRIPFQRRTLTFSRFKSFAPLLRYCKVIFISHSGRCKCKSHHHRLSIRREMVLPVTGSFAQNDHDDDGERHQACLKPLIAVADGKSPTPPPPTMPITVE